MGACSARKRADRGARQLCGRTHSKGWMQEKQQSAESHEKGVWKELIVAVTLLAVVVRARERCENISHATL